MLRRVVHIGVCHLLSPRVIRCRGCCTSPAFLPAVGFLTAECPGQQGPWSPAINAAQRYIWPPLPEPWSGLKWAAVRRRVLYRPARPIRGVRRHGPAGLATKMTRPYLAGELSALFADFPVRGQGNGRRQAA